eukprot:15433171-Alexandrium_andersonii.AAC.1
MAQACQLSRQWARDLRNESQRSARPAALRTMKVKGRRGLRHCAQCSENATHESLNAAGSASGNRLRQT